MTFGEVKRKIAVNFVFPFDGRSNKVSDDGSIAIASIIRKANNSDHVIKVTIKKIQDSFFCTFTFSHHNGSQFHSSIISRPNIFFSENIRYIEIFFDR